MRNKKFAPCKFCDQEFQKRRSSSKFCSRHCQSSYLSANKISGRKKRGGNLFCPICKKEFYVPQYRLKNPKTRYCSRSCLAKEHLPKYIEKYGFKKQNLPQRKYKYIIVDGKRLREHRYIMQQHVGRKLERWEHVHHINGDSSDNRIENLALLSNSDHQLVEYILKYKTRS